MSDKEKKEWPPLEIREPSAAASQEPDAAAPGKPGEEKMDVVGIPLGKTAFMTLFDSHEDPNVMILSIPIRALAMDTGKDALALLLGKIELFKGEAHKVYKGIKADVASKGPKIIVPGGRPLGPLGRA